MSWLFHPLLTAAAEQRVDSPSILSVSRYDSSFAHGTGSYATSSFTPENDSLLLVFVMAQDVNNNLRDSNFTISDSEGLTWTGHVGAYDDGVTSSYTAAAIKAFTAQVSTAASMTVTVDAGSRDVAQYSVFVLNISAINSSDPIGGVDGVGDEVISASPISLTLDATPSDSSLLVGAAFGIHASTAITKGANWVSLYDPSLGSTANIEAHIQRRLSTTSDAVDWASFTCNYAYCAVALEIKAVATASPISGTISPSFTVSGTLGGRGALAGTISPTFATSGALLGRAAITGSTDVAFSTAATLVGIGDLAGTSSPTFSASGVLVALGSMAGASSPAFALSGTLSGTGALAGTSSPTFSTSGSLTGAGALTGTISPAFSTAGALIGKGQLSGSANVAFSTSGELSALSDGSISGATTVSFSTSGTLTGRGAMSGAATPVFTTSGGLAGTGELVGSSDLAFTVTGDLGTFTPAVTAGGHSGTSRPAKGAKAKPRKRAKYDIEDAEEALEKARRKGKLRKIGLEDGGAAPDGYDSIDGAIEALVPQSRKVRRKRDEAGDLVPAQQILPPSLDVVMVQVQRIIADATDKVKQEQLALLAEEQDEEDVLELLLLSM